MSGNFTVMTPEQEERLRKLEEFYATIRQVALKSNLYEDSTLATALSKVDPLWRASDLGDLESRN